MKAYEEYSGIGGILIYTFKMLTNFIIQGICKIPGKLKQRIYLYFNRLYFRLYGANIGSNFKVFNHIYLSCGKNVNVTIGNNFLFMSGDSYNPLCRNMQGCISLNEGASLTIGDNVGISSACIWVHKSITIGNNVKIGGDCILLDSDCHSLDYLKRRDVVDQAYKVDKAIVIEDDVLIGTRCIILKGVRIGARSIIGSGSVVTKDIPADCVAAGNPAKVLRSL